MELIEQPVAIADAREGAWVVGVPTSSGHHLSSQGGLFASAGPVEVSFAGYLSARAKFRTELQAGTDATDAALVLNAYRQWGLAMLGRLRGAFAFVLVDASQGLRMAARDPLGVHPLFYAERGDSLLFASNAKTLAHQPGVSSAVNRMVLADHLCWRWADPNETFFQSVKRVPPGSHVLVQPGRITVTRHWNPAPDESQVDWITRAEDVRFDEHFERAVSRCLEHGPAGVFLSGGLDSVSVAAVAADVQRRSGGVMPRALSLRFPHSECDESAVQTSVAKTLGMPQDLVDFWSAVGTRGLIAPGLDLNARLSAPLLNLWGPAYLSLAATGRASGVRAIMTGSGGDEWLTLTPYLSADLMRRGDLASVLRLAASWHRSNRLPAWQQAYIAGWRFGVRPLMSQGLARLTPGAWSASRNRRAVSRDPKWVAPDPELRKAQIERAPLTLGEADPKGGFYVRELTEALRHPLVLWELEEQHEFGQLAQTPLMHPYWDADLIDTLYRTSPMLLNSGGRSKGMVRDAVHRRFPALGLGRQKKIAATSFFRQTAANEGAAAFDTIGRDFKVLGEMGVVDRKQAEAAVNESLSPSSPGLKQALSLINLESWVRVQA